MNRQYANLLILARIKAEIEAYPDMRFGQILRNLGVVDAKFVDGEAKWTNTFHEEPSVTLDRMQKVAALIAG
jgi:hypothetical protein